MRIISVRENPEYKDRAIDYIGVYEKYGFQYIGQGYHPWGEESRIYQADL